MSIPASARLGLLCLCLCLPRAAAAGTASFRQGERGYQGVTDLTISTQNAKYTQGHGITDLSGGHLMCYQIPGDNGYETRALLRFEGLRLPPGAKVSAATLTLVFDNWSTGFTIRGSYLQPRWDPKLKVSWLSRGAARWAGPGADKEGQDVIAGKHFVLAGFKGNGVELLRVALDPQVVQAWIKDPAQNQGILLVNEKPGATTRLASSEDKDPERRPLLTIRYSAPGEPAASADEEPLPAVGSVASLPPPPPPRPAAAPRPPLPTGKLAPPQLAASPGRPRLLLDAARLTWLWRRAAVQDPAWVALRERCDAYLTGVVEWSDGKDYPGGGNIGEGYQGSDYFEALMNVALCYQTARHGDKARAQSYAKKGLDLLTKLSELTGPHAPLPLRNSGYGIRFFGVGMALGYDWFHEALPPALRERIQQALQRWIGDFEAKGFGRQHPQGNYFAGYYSTKGLAGLALQGEPGAIGAFGAAQWQDFLGRLHGRFVQPYYAANLGGGGWPEGWNYGPVATFNMALPIWGARTALGQDLTKGPSAFPFPLEQGAHLVHFTWPSRRTLDDRQVQYPNENPSSASPALFTFQAALLSAFGDGLAPQFHRYARAVRDALARTPPPLWEDFLFWDEDAKEQDFRALPLSFATRGMNTVAMRSSWEERAVWASFTSGPYINYDGSGEQFYDQGALVIVQPGQPGRHGRPFLVNAVAALNRHTPGTQDGEKTFDIVYNDLYNKGNRTLFSIFYVDQPRPYGQEAYGPGQEEPSGEPVRTRLARYEDQGAYVLLRGEALEDMYRHRGRVREVERWVREVVYLRPDRFVVHDQTRVRDAGADQWLAWHFGQPLGEVATQVAGAHRYDVGSGDRYLGTVSALLPKGHGAKLVDLFGRGKVHRLEMRPAAREPAQRWLTVLQAAQRARQAARVSRLSPADGAILEGRAEGAYLSGEGGAQVVLFSAQDDPGQPMSVPLRYQIPQPAPGAEVLHLITSLSPDRGYQVRVVSANGAQQVALSADGPFRPTPQGTLRVRVNAAGAVAAP